MNSIAKRDKCLDSLKYLAMIEVIVIHFMYFFCENLLNYLRLAYPFSLIFQGLSAKIGVAIFSVISGYFAYRSKEKNPVKYILKKYLYYLIYCFIANLIYFLINYEHRPYFDLIYLIQQSFLLDDGIYYYLWFVKTFFIGDVICYLLGRFNIPIYGILAVFVILLALDELEIAVFIFGCLLSLLMDFDHPVIRNGILHCAFIFMVYKLYKIEHHYMYLFYGICGVLLFIIIEKNKYIHKIMDNRFTAFLGRYTMSILIVSYAAMIFFEKIGLTRPLELLFILWFLLTHVVAYVIDLPIRYIVVYLNGQIDKFFEKIELKGKVS